MRPACLLALGVVLANAVGLQVTGPDGNVVFTLLGGDHLTYQAALRNQLLLDKSPLGLSIDGVDLGDHPRIGAVDRYKVEETYATRGVHSNAVNRCNGAKISLGAGTLEVRSYNDGIAFRFIVLGRGARTPDAATGFALPAGSVAWYHDLKGHYEGVHQRRNISDVPAGDWAAVPLTFKLPNGAGYGSISESALINYSGMVLQAGGQRMFRERLGHAPPASYPFTLRYGDEEAARLSKPAAIEGAIRTPWRIVMAGPDLNTLVNSDLVTNLAADPDPKLFPQGYRTEWIKPGRSLWRLFGRRRQLS